MNAPQARFTPLARLLHWSMAVMILAMLFVGIGMVSTATERYRYLLALHRPLGILILGRVSGVNSTSTTFPRT